MSKDSDKRGSRDNTDLPHQPKDAQSYVNAPRGHLGVSGQGNPSPGLGSTSPSHDVTNALEGKQVDQPNQLSIEENPRQTVVETGDAEVDKFYNQDKQRGEKGGEFSGLIARKQAEMGHTTALRELASHTALQRSDPRPSFVETGDEEVDKFYAQDSRMIEKGTEFANLIERKLSSSVGENEIRDKEVGDKGDESI